jgi:hypothetical protein
MGWTDWLADKTKAGARILDPGGIFIGGSVPNQPGVSNGQTPHPNETGGVNGAYIDPTTGYQYDPNSGTTYTSDGTIVTNPNVAQQVAQNYATSRTLLGGLGQANSQRQTAFNGQKGLLSSLDNTISGAGPSVAQNQLTQGLGQIQRTQMAGAAGASGSNAFAARRAALSNIGNASSAADQSAAILRAKEINDAQTAKAGVLNSIAGHADTQADQAITGGGAFADKAAGGQAGQQGLDYGAAAQQNKDKKDTSNKIFSLIGSMV